MRSSSTLASDAAGGHGVLDQIVRPIRPGSFVSAPPSTVRISPNYTADLDRLEQQAVRSAS